MWLKLILNVKHPESCEQYILITTSWNTWIHNNSKGQYYIQYTPYTIQTWSSSRPAACVQGVAAQKLESNWLNYFENFY